MSFIIHTSGPVKIGNVVLGGITNLDSALGNQVRGEASSGEIQARVKALYSQKPTAGFTTDDIANALAATGVNGLSLASKNLVLYGSRRDPGGRIASSGHASFTHVAGVLVPGQLSVAHQGNATLSFAATIYDDGVNDPVVISTGASLPSIAGVEHWTLASCQIGGVTIDQEINVGLSFGFQVVGEGADSNVRDSIASIRGQDASITIASSQLGNLMDLLGQSGALSIVLRKRAPGGTFADDRLTISGASLAVMDRPFQVGGQGTAQVAIAGHVLWDGTHDPITVTRS